jgi:hypothetical protein
MRIPMGIAKKQALRNPVKTRNKLSNAWRWSKYPGGNPSIAKVFIPIIISIGEGIL